MFVCIAGKNNIAIDVTEYLLSLKRQIDIGVVYNSTETGKDGWQRSFRKYAEKKKLKSYKLEEIYDMDDVVFISLEYDRIIKPSKFKNARLYNIHFSLLPYYKGMYTSALPILNNESKVGVTFHKIDSGIDTGDIIAQKSFSLKDMTCRELYFSYIKYGTELVIKYLEQVLDSKEQAYQQRGEISTYYSKSSIDYNNIIVDLNQTALGIYNQIRAFNFREYQLPKIYGTPIIGAKITTIRSIDKPGTIIFENKSEMFLATVDYNIIVYKDRLDELLYACEIGDSNMVKDICNVKEHINAQNNLGWSSLMVSTYNNYIDIVEFLISQGADIKMVNNNGTNMLMYAKDAYIKSNDNTLFKLYKRMGLSEYDKDYNGHDLLYYIRYNNIEFSELVS